MQNATCIWLTKINGLELESDLAKALMPQLAADELERFTLYPRAVQKVCFLLSRTLLRCKLAEALNTTPQQLNFTCSDKGKPFLAAPFNHLNFNLSHSGDWIALCISRAEACGIDIEHPHKKRNTMPIANSYFHSDEVNALNELTGAEQTDYFYKLWTLKEAFLKARGTGITEGLNKINFKFKNNEAIPSIDSSLKDPESGWDFYTWLNPIENNAINNTYLSLALRNNEHTQFKRVQPTLNYITPKELVQ